MKRNDFWVGLAMFNALVAFLYVMNARNQQQQVYKVLPLPPKPRVNIQSLRPPIKAPAINDPIPDWVAKMLKTERAKGCGLSSTDAPRLIECFRAAKKKCRQLSFDDFQEVIYLYRSAP